MMNTVTLCRDALEATADEIRNQTGTEVLAGPTHVSQPDQVENLISTAIEHFNGISTGQNPC